MIGRPYQLFCICYNCQLQMKLTWPKELARRKTKPTVNCVSKDKPTIQSESSSFNSATTAEMSNTLCLCASSTLISHG